MWAASERTLIATTRRLRPALVQRHAVAAYGAVADVCVQRLGATAAEAEKAEARLLNEPARWKAERMCDALEGRLGLNEVEIKKVVLSLPSVLGYSIEENVLPSLSALQSRLGLSELELKKVVLRLPQVLGYSIEANLLPKIDWLQHETNLSDDELRHKLVSQPAMLSYSLRDRLQPRAALCDEFGVSRSLLWSYHGKSPPAFREACEKAAQRACLSLARERER